MSQIIEIRSYNLKAGTRADFHALVSGEVMPMLKRWKTDVVAFGPSLQDGDAYYLIRCYKDLKDLDAQQDAFYGSDEWKQGPREAVLSFIDSMASVVLEVDDVTLAGLRK